MSTPAPEDSIPSTPAAPDNALLSDAPGEDNAPLQPPTPLTNTPLAASLRNSLAPSGTAPLVPEAEKNLEENAVEPRPDQRKSLLRRPVFWLAATAAIVAVVLAVVLPVYFKVIKTKNNTSTPPPTNNTGGGGGDNGGDNSGPPNPSGGLTTGGDGSTVTMENGTQFTYRNPFGGFCACILFCFPEGMVLQLNRRGVGSGESVQ